MRVILGLALLATTLAAQPDRFITYTNAAGASLQSNLIEIDDTAASLRTLMTLNGDKFPRAIVMHDNNVDFRLVGNDPFRGYAGFVYDVTPGGVVTTVVEGFPLLNPFAILRADDGEWILFDRVTSQSTNVYRLAGSTLRATGTITGLDIEGVALNPENGKLIARAWIAPTPPYMGRGHFEIDLSTGRHTTLTPPPAGSNIDVQLHGARQPLYRAGVGEFFDPLYNHVLRGMQVFRIAPGSIKAFTGPFFAQYPTDFIRAGGRAFPVEYHLLTRSLSIPVSYSIVQLRGSGNAVSGNTQPQSLGLDAFAPLMRIGSRHMAWFKGATTTRRRLEVDFPGEAGRLYFVGVSAAGLRPGFALADGRWIPLALDGLAIASLNGGLPGILDGTAGRLDATGHATVTLDWTVFGRAVSGTRLWSVAVVIDPAASSSVAHISEPLRLVIP